MVIITACGLPNPSIVDYDLLLVCVTACDPLRAILDVRSFMHTGQTNTGVS